MMMVATTLTSMLQRAVRPLILEAAAGDPYSYWLNGSGFLLRSRRTYFITARHVIEDTDPNRVRVLTALHERAFVPIDLATLASSNFSDDAADLAVFRAAEPRINPIPSQDGLCLNPSTDLAKGDNLAVVGFPGERKGVDYDQLLIRVTTVALRGVYSGPGFLPGCHEITITDNSGLRSLAGLSGSPVVCVRNRHKYKDVITLAGVLITGEQVDTGPPQFAPVEVLFRIIRGLDSGITTGPV